MKSKNLIILVIIVLFNNFSYSQESTAFASEEEIKSQIKLVSCKDEERLEAVKNIFVKVGAKESQIRIESLKSVKNLVVIKNGKTDEIVVVGAHYDKTSEGCGVIDNWSGIVILANLYKTLNNYSTEKTYYFVAFDKEEKGLIGSGEMADNIPKEQRSKYCAMVNFDSFGFTYPQVLRNISDTSLIKLAEEVSKEMKIPFSQAEVNASSDSQSFRRKKIPALTLHGLSDKWRDYLHSSSDNIENLNPQSVYIGYRHGLVFLSKIDNKPCDSFRK